MRHTRIHAPEYVTEPATTEEPALPCQPGPRRAFGATARGLIAAVCLGVVLAAPGISTARDYDPKKAGNPLKIVYYIAYPVGWTLDVLIFRPAYYIGQCQPFKTIFGTDRHPEDIERDTDDRASDAG